MSPPARRYSLAEGQRRHNATPISKASDSSTRTAAGSEGGAPGGFTKGFTSATLDGGNNWRDANDVGLFLNRFRFFGSPVTLGYASGNTIYKYSSDRVPQPDLLLAATRSRKVRF